MYARGLTTRQISGQIEEIYGFECSESFISDVTDKVMHDIEDWQNSPLNISYLIFYIGAVNRASQYRRDPPKNCHRRLIYRKNLTLPDKS